MSSKHFLVVCMTLCTFYLSAQTNEVQRWSEENPSVLLIETADADSEYLESLDAKNIQYIVYSQEVSLSDISAFEAKYKPLKTDDLDENSAAEIKKWLAEHPDVKIIKRSYFDQLDASRQSVYQNTGALILIGEEISLEDIHNFE